MSPKEMLHALFESAVDAADPAKNIAAYLPKGVERLLVIGAGKAAASMAKAVEDAWQGELSGLVVTRYGHSVPTSKIEVVEASHPLPDEAGLQAAKRILSMAHEAGENDYVLCLISGGGSALLSMPTAEIKFAEKQRINQQLLKSGATIAEMNCVRKHLSAVKGGRLAQAVYPAQSLTLLISDVPGDDLSVIASGPMVADPSSLADCLTIIERYDIAVSDTIMAWLQTPEAETPKPDSKVFDKAELQLIATPMMSLQAAAEKASELGLNVHVLSGEIEGEAKEIGKMHASLARHIAHHESHKKPIVLLSGGETTVTVKGKGRGGRNAEFLLSFVLQSQGAKGIYAIACDTDGIDGIEDNAGAIATPDTLQRALDVGESASGRLENNDAYSFFKELDDLVMTGPTLTNVNDFRAVIII